MIEQTVEELTPIVGTRPACRALGSLRVFLCIGGWLGVVGDAVSEVDA